MNILQMSSNDNALTNKHGIVSQRNKQHLHKNSISDECTIVKQAYELAPVHHVFERGTHASRKHGDKHDTIN